MRRKLAAVYLAGLVSGLVLLGGGLTMAADDFRLLGKGLWLHPPGAAHAVLGCANDHGQPNLRLPPDTKPMPVRDGWGVMLICPH